MSIWKNVCGKYRIAIAMDRTDFIPAVCGKILNMSYAIMKLICNDFVIYKTNWISDQEVIKKMTF